MFDRRTFALAMGILLLLIPATALAGTGPAAEAGSDFLKDGWVWAYLLAFGAGFATSLTPCVYPMIAITVAVFGARDEGVTRGKAFGLATAYVLGMALLYSALGVASALLGMQFGSFLANPWVVIPLVGLLVGLAASMFGAFDIALPASVQARLNQVGGKGWGGAFAMGLVGGLIAAPCTGPFLAGILAFVATTKSVVAGSTMLMTYAIGMGVLFWVIAAFAVSVPKSGAWMEGVKSGGGILLVALAIYFLMPILPRLQALTDPGVSFLIGALAVAAVGVAIGAVHLSFHAAWPTRLRKGLGVGLTVVGLTGAINWALTPDRKLPWQHDEQAAFAEARAQGKGVMIDFAADWCLPCKELEVQVFADQDVYDTIVANFVPLKFDVSEGTDQDDERQEKWNAETLPAVIFVDADGNELRRVSELVTPHQFMTRTLKPAIERLRARAAGPAGSGGSPDRATPRHMGAAGDTGTTRVHRGAAGDTGTADEDLGAASHADTADGDPGAAGDTSGAEGAGTGALSWVTSESAAFTRARSSGKGVLIDFYSQWCVPCMELDKTLSDQRVAAAVTRSYVPLRFDVTRDTTADQAALARYGVSLLPSVLFVDATGAELGRITEVKRPDEFLAAMAMAGH